MTNLQGRKTSGAERLDNQGTALQAQEGEIHLETSPALRAAAAAMCTKVVTASGLWLQDPLMQPPPWLSLLKEAKSFYLTKHKHPCSQRGLLCLYGSLCGHRVDSCALGNVTMSLILDTTKPAWCSALNLNTFSPTSQYLTLSCVGLHLGRSNLMHSVE